VSVPPGTTGKPMGFSTTRKYEPRRPLPTFLELGSLTGSYKNQRHQVPTISERGGRRKSKQRRKRATPAAATDKDGESAAPEEHKELESQESPELTASKGTPELPSSRGDVEMETVV
jgi:hypothetical protein